MCTCFLKILKSSVIFFFFNLLIIPGKTINFSLLTGVFSSVWNFISLERVLSLCGSAVEDYVFHYSEYACLIYSKKTSLSTRIHLPIFRSAPESSAILRTVRVPKLAHSAACDIVNNFPSAFRFFKAFND